MSKLKAWFVGKEIMEIAFTYDWAGISFTDNSGMTIYNPCSLADGFHPSRYIGQTVIAEFWSADVFYIELRNAEKITVDFKDNAWRGPEAIVYHSEESGYMVVNESPDVTVMFREETNT